MEDSRDRTTRERSSLPQSAAGESSARHALNRPRSSYMGVLCKYAEALPTAPGLHLRPVCMHPPASSVCRLVEEIPEHVVAWFAVGCYYQAIGRYDSARQYFGKATAVDPSFAPAWLGFGHSFAAQDESDQVCPALVQPLSA